MAEPVKDLEMEDLAVLFVMFLEGKMEEGTFGFTADDLNDYASVPSYPEIGEAKAPSKAMLFQGGSISMIPGSSGDLHTAGYEPFPDSHFDTQFALIVTKALATFHATLCLQGTKTLLPDISEDKLVDVTDESNYSSNDSSSSAIPERDEWTCQVTRPAIVAANLSILNSNFKYIGVSSRIVEKLESMQTDLATLTQFLQFAAMMQSSSRIQSVGPVNMCDIWVPSGIDQGEDVIVIRLRGGPELQAPPMRDTAWVWLTLIRPDVLRERYMELCDLYCTSFNNRLERIGSPGDSKHVDDLTLFDIMRDLGESFLHGFLTMVHKSTVSGVWALDRQLHTREGTHILAESMGFLVDNGIIGSLFIA